MEARRHAGTEGWEETKGRSDKVGPVMCLWARGFRGLFCGKISIGGGAVSRYIFRYAFV
jgi:hypothetical protein